MHALRWALAAGILCAACLLPACGTVHAPSTVRAPDVVPPGAASPGVTSPETTLYVVRRRWHIDVGFARADLEPSLESVAQQFPGAKFLLFGFGDRHYLLARSHGPPNLIRALWPGPGLMLVTALEGSPQAAFGEREVIELRVSSVQAHHAQDFILRSLRRESEGSIAAPAADGPYPDSRYFEAVPRYSGAYTCNTWAADALRAAALPVRSRLTLLAGQLWSQVTRLATAQSQGGGLPLLHTVVLPPWGTTTVVLAGGGGLELLMQPASSPRLRTALNSTFID